MHEGKHGIIDRWDDDIDLFAEDDGAGRDGRASKKKGSIVLKKNGFLKVTYSHRNSEPEGIGAGLVQWIRSAGAASVSAYFDRVNVIREEDPMTDEQRENYRKYVPETLWKPDMTWTEALAWTKNAVAPLRDGYPWMIDYSGFSGVWINRWRYIIDLDTNEFAVIIGGMEMICQPEDRYSSEFTWPDKLVHTEIGRFPLERIPDNWIELCRKRFGGMMIIAVDYSRNSEAMHSEEIQEAGEGHGGYNPYDTDWENIQFFYGQNRYGEMISDME
ncbi:MAG: hypothetical protein IKQ10_02580 [Oscillospiraceae bacterium]|nr:hypothetical protein [Oscillospiraceae bacterium]